MLFRITFSFFLIIIANISYLVFPNVTIGTSLKTNNSPNIVDSALTPQQVMRKITGNMIFVDSGSFLMGSDYRVSNEHPLTRLHISQFYVDKYEITQAEWKGLMGEIPNSFQNCPDCPVEGVSWNDAMQFIAKLNQMSCKHFRLLTEAEWEYAERGGSKGHNYKYSGSDNLEEVAWYSGNAEKKLHRIGQKIPNQLGIYDMTGNVSEWCSNWYDYNYYRSIPQNDPQGPLSGSDKIIRGASFKTNRSEIWPAMYVFDSPCKRREGIGFRLAEDL